MTVRKLTRAAVGCVCAVVALVALAAGSAQALITHHYIPGSLPQLAAGVPAEGPHGETVPLPGPLSLGGASMTIDSGHLWIAETARHTDSGSPLYRVDEFDAASGAFIEQLTSAESAPHYGEYGIAVAHVGGQSQIYMGESLNPAETAPAVGVFGEAGGAESTWTGAGTPAGSFGEGERQFVHVATDNSASPADEHAGDLFVSVSAQHAIDIFQPAADGEEHYVGQIDAADIAGWPSGAPFEPGKLAVSEATGDVVVLNGTVYDILEPGALGQYTLAGEISGTPSGPLTPFNLAIDGASGEIYTTDGFNPTVIDEFSPTGDFLGRIAGSDTPAGSIGDVYTLGVDPQTHELYVADDGGGGHAPIVDVFGPDVVLPDVSTGAATNTAFTGATLNGTVNPDGGGVATCRFEWGTSEFFGELAPCEPEAAGSGSTPVAVHAALTGLLPDTTYFYRLQASNANGTNHGEPSQDMQFTTPGPGIRHESVSDIADTSATFGATINPHGAPASFYFQYGTSTAYGAEAPAPPGEAVGSGETDVDVHPYHVQDLTAGTVYHYRVVVRSEVKPGVFIEFDGPDQTFATQTAAVSTLLDGRQWEMVTPPNKQGATIGSISEVSVLQAAAGGDAIAFDASSPTEVGAQGDAGEQQVIATRAAQGWQSRDVSPPHEHATGTGLGVGPEYRFFSEDLSNGLVQPFGTFTASMSPEASEQTPYLATLRGQCTGTCYRPLVTGKTGYANVPSGTVFSNEREGRCQAAFCGPVFRGATSDLAHIVLSSKAALVASAPTGTESLYEWTAGQLALVSVLPNGEPSAAADLARTNADMRHAISDDGSRVVWEAQGAQGHSEIFMRDIPQGRTIQLASPEAACVANGGCPYSGPGFFQLANADGSKVFFTDGSRLTSNASRGGSDLYECEIVEGAGGIECALHDLTPPHDEEATRVDGQVIGASEDGSYVYFVADGALAEGAVRGDCSQSGSIENQKCNLYVRHDGTTRLVAVLGIQDSHDWIETLGVMPARVSPNGRWLAFMSQLPLTGYDNRDDLSGEPDAEVYLYDAASGRLVCASCNPTGARPSGVLDKELSSSDGSLAWPAEQWVAASVPGWLDFTQSTSLYQPRYLSDSGRLFFNSHDALVPQDVNGTEDVYEYEPSSVGSCTTTDATFDGGSGGCVGLVSSGTSAQDSAFMDASESGGDVFFMTYSKLAGSDYDEAEDVYDAHECTSGAPCFPAETATPPPCTTADACRTAPTPQPAIFGAPSSATFSGAGNVTPATGGKPSAKKRSSTRAQKRAKALRSCRTHKRGKAREACERRARARYRAAGSPARKQKSEKKGKR
jgi:hypothetical protein